VDVLEPEPTATVPTERQPAGDVEVADDPDQWVGCMDDDPLLYTEEWKEASSSRRAEAALPFVTDEREFYRFPSRASSTDVVTGDSGKGASPSLPSFENGLVVYLDALTARVGGRRFTFVGAQSFIAGMALGAVEIARYDHRPEAAVVREMIARLVPTASGEVTFAMRSTWLAKGLLQQKRRFRAPILFQMVIELHEHARHRGREVSIAGGVCTPAPIWEALEAAVDRAARETA
jgi:hypothetical protein